RERPYMAQAERKGKYLQRLYDLSITTVPLALSKTRKGHISGLFRILGSLLIYLANQGSTFAD
ncbi:hypothetical protein, partial [Pectobacterium brasiliense]|uniref:hypothetical protein n=1 Tax=Pectobacterium brasiliense TaxID=180957 RepID=UPI001C5DD4F5